MWINRKAKYEYNIEEVKEAGVVLRGSEVKSVRRSGVDLSVAYAAVHTGEFWIYNMTIAQYQFADSTDVQVTKRPKKLLLNAREIKRWMGASTRPGYTLIPLKGYFTQRGFFKLEIGLCSGKNKRDKRAAEREKELRREVQSLD